MPKKTEDITYNYIGGGQGVPGLPHTVTSQQAAALGLLDELKAAISRGDYVAREPRQEE